MKDQFRTLKLACYTTNISMSIVSNLPPVLFLTFRQLYGISYSLLGLLVVFNFVTQLTVDLIFSFFSHKFNIEKTVRATPLFCAAGLILFAIWPFLFPGNVYLGLVIGTIIFSAGSGLAEVLISPVIAAIPSDDPDRQMSALHSVYAWGVVFVIIFSTLFLLAFGGESWPYLTMILAAIPVISGILFSRSRIPAMQTPEKITDTLRFLKDKGLWLCVFAIFLGGATECNMAQWCSSYLEQAMGIQKIWGDVFGVAVFAALLGFGRTTYARRGKNMGKVLLLGATGATICYFVAGITSIPLLGLVACGLTGLCASMLWPGNLVVAADRFPAGGVFLYAMMAAGGDLGASVAPQLIGLITDASIASPSLSAFAVSLGLAPEQLGMKLGMLTGMLFPLIMIFVCIAIRKDRKMKGLET